LDEISAFRRLSENEVNDEGDILFDITIDEMSLRPPMNVSDESYKLDIINSTYWKMQCVSYPSFTKAMETYSQLVTVTGPKTNKNFLLY